MLKKNYNKDNHYKNKIFIKKYFILYKNKKSIIFILK
jgi:hypothetical protein